MQLRRSLRRATLMSMAVALLPGMLIVFLFARHVTLRRSSEILVDSTAAVIRPQLKEFHRIEDSVSTLAQALSRRFDEPPNAEELAAFDAAVARDDAGVVRNRRERFDGTREAGVFIPSGVELTDDLKRRKWRAMQVLSSYGLAALTHVDGVWFDQPDKTSVIFWRPDPNFIYTLPADHDYTQTLWDQLASPRLNPSRRPMWTPAILESTIRTWVISCVVPVDRDGQWVGTVGHDVALGDLLRSFDSPIYAGTQHFLLDLDPDKDGRVGGEGAYIVAGPWQQALLAASGEFRPDLRKDPDLRALLWDTATKGETLGGGITLRGHPDDLPIVRMQGRDYLALVLDIEPLRWRYVQLAPLNAVLTPMYASWLGLVGVLLLIAAVATLSMRHLIRREIVEPIDRVRSVVRAYGRGDRVARTGMRGLDPLAQLGQAFDAMAEHTEGTLRALQDSESRYRSVVENVREVIFQCDAYMRLEYLSPAWDELALRPAMGCVGHLLTEYVHAEDAARLREDFQAVFVEPTRSGFGTYRLLCSDGAMRWVEIGMQRVSSGGRAVCIGSIDDITGRLQAQKEMMRLQEQLRQSQKMEALGRLTGGVAHDYNNILAIILGYTELAMEQDGTRNGGALRPLLERVLQAGERGRDLVGKMLTFSRRKVGAPVPTDAAPVIAEAAAMLRATIPSNIDITTDIDPAAGSVRVDPTGLHQMVMNLVINARDAMPDGGAIVVRLRGEAAWDGVCTACHADIAGRYVAVEVEDDGSGIPASLLPSIFDPFFTTKDVGKGTGMGLSVVHGIVHESGGHIVVDSDESVGTTIRLLLPAATAEVGAPVSSMGAAERRVGSVPMDRPAAHILVVDDEPELVRLWERALARHGHRVEGYTDPRVAMDAFRTGPRRYDAVILDQTMPALGGDALAREMLALRPDLPLILCTGYSDRIDAASAEALGIRRYLAKPVAVATMMAALDEVLAATPARIAS